jgi:hypothetical protein
LCIDECKFSLFDENNTWHRYMKKQKQKTIPMRTREEEEITTTKRTI